MKGRMRNILDFKKPSRRTVIVVILLGGVLIAGSLLNKLDKSATINAGAEKTATNEWIPITSNSYWMVRNTGNSPDRDETLGKMYREIELPLENDGKYHFVGIGTGAMEDSGIYNYVESPEPISSPEPRGGIDPPQRVITAPDYAESPEPISSPRPQGGIDPPQRIITTPDYAEGPEPISSPRPQGGIDPPQRIITTPTGEPYSSAARHARKYYKEHGYDRDVITIQSVSSDYSAEGRDFLNELKDETVTLSVEFSTDPRSHKIRLIVLTREEGGEWDIIRADG